MIPPFNDMESARVPNNLENDIKQLYNVLWKYMYTL